MNKHEHEIVPTHQFFIVRLIGCDAEAAGLVRVSGIAAISIGAFVHDAGTAISLIILRQSPPIITSDSNFAVPPLVHRKENFFTVFFAPPPPPGALVIKQLFLAREQKTVGKSFFFYRT
jgi:hypothetical protein